MGNTEAIPGLIVPFDYAASRALYRETWRLMDEFAEDMRERMFVEDLARHNAWIAGKRARGI